jgi:tripartite-type tricarboxylate transporter receptor subunit TctC
MARQSLIIGFGLAALLATGAVTSAVPATAAEPSWKGKTFKVVVRSGPGGGYDFYGRLISRHMRKYLPGTPRSIVINMAGAGGIVAGNYLMSRAKRDGTEIAILTRAVTIAQKMGETGIKYDVAKLNPIGSAAASTWVWVMNGKHPVKSLTDLKKFKGGTIKFSGTGRGSASYQRVKMLEFEGMPVKVITGYDGNEEKVLSIARGDVQGTSGSFESLRSYIKDNNFTIIGRMGYHPGTKGVEQATEVFSKDGAALAAFASAQDLAGRPFFGPPGLDPAVLKAMRAAFRDALKDKELLGQAKKAKRSISHTSGEQMVKIYAQILGASAGVIEKFKSLSAVPTETIAGKVSDVKRQGRVGHFGGKKIGISKSRSKVTINGKKGSRGNIKAGMTCKVKAGKRGSGLEAQTIDCNS